MNKILNLIMSILAISGKNSFGGFGFEEPVQGNTFAEEARFGYIVALEDATFSFENDVTRGIKVGTDYLLLKGDSLYGNFKITAMGTGKLRSYYNDKF